MAGSGPGVRPTFDRRTRQWQLSDGLPEVPPPELARVRPPRRRRLWVVGVALAFVLGIGIGGVAFGGTGLGGERPAPAAVLVTPTPAPVLAPVRPPAGVARTYQLEVAVTEGSMRVLGTVMWSTGHGIETRRNVPTPWRTEVTIPADRPHDTAQLTAMLPADPDGDDAITCTLRQGDRNLATQTGHGDFAVVSCNSSRPAPGPMEPGSRVRTVTGSGAPRTRAPGTQDRPRRDDGTAGGHGRAGASP